jgi:hypothetical protein
VRDGRCGPVCRIGDKAFFATHETDCGCAQCTHDDAAPLPLDEDLRELAEGAQENIVQALYREQERREKDRPLDLDDADEDENTDLYARAKAARQRLDKEDTKDQSLVRVLTRPIKRTGRRIHLHF